MSERYTELYRLPSRYCLEGCPLYVEAGTLLKDNENGKVLVQLKICNLSKYKVMSCKVTINSYEPNGNLLETVRHQFMDVDGATGSFFGTREPIYLSENTARKYDVCITEIVFDNDDVWTGTEIKWNEIDAQEKISDYFSDKELVEQFYRETGRQSVYVPRVIGGIYQCACGTLNINPEYKCRSCKQEYSVYDRFLNKEYLKERLDERKEREFRIAEEKRIREEEEKARKEEEERQREKEAEQRRIEKEEKTKEKKRKAKKIIIIASVAIFVILSVSVGSIFVYREATYKKAQKLLAAGAYDEAQVVFGKLGDYKDSTTLATEAVYKKAEQYYDSGEYDKASDEWSKIKEYSDSMERIDACKYEPEYQKALLEMESQNYTSAIDLFAKLGKYKDAKEKEKECQSLQMEGPYQNAIKLMNSKKYQEALDEFEGIKNYKDAKEMINECQYQMAIGLLDDKKYQESISLLKKIGNYKDGKDLVKSTSYEYGCILFESKSYNKAIAAFKDAKGYNDAKQKKLEAEYAYVMENPDIMDVETPNYLQDLVDNNYPGADALYQKLTAWKAEIRIVYARSIEGNESFAEENEYFVDVKVTGVDPGKQIGTDIGKEIQVRFIYPDGSQSKTDYKPVRNGGGSYAWSIYPNSRGKLTVKVYDNQENLLGSASINTTN